MMLCARHCNPAGRFSHGEGRNCIRPRWWPAGGRQHERWWPAGSTAASSTGRPCCARTPTQRRNFRRRRLLPAMAHAATSTGTSTASSSTASGSSESPVASTSAAAPLAAPFSTAGGSAESPAAPTSSTLTPTATSSTACGSSASPVVPTSTLTLLPTVPTSTRSTRTRAVGVAYTSAGLADGLPQAGATPTDGASSWQWALKDEMPMSESVRVLDGILLRIPPTGISWSRPGYVVSDEIPPVCDKEIRKMKLSCDAFHEKVLEVHEVVKDSGRSVTAIAWTMRWNIAFTAKIVVAGIKHRVFYATDGLIHISALWTAAKRLHSW
mmetsp:Transcript_79455/g.233520  ORF Transcript_79455/g.233520 Transcript_79455/m.233520 type:complete len:325 (+) Transcript_79455:57-1031(+)